MEESRKKLIAAKFCLEEEYEKALKMEYVRNPIAYALYQTWCRFDDEKPGKKGVQYSGAALEAAIQALEYGDLMR